MKVSPTGMASDLFGEKAFSDLDAKLSGLAGLLGLAPVSYTHLTLPTTAIV